MTDAQTRVLIVEDDPSIRASLAGFLEDYGYLVVAVESGEEALEALGGENFEVAIVDIRLPGIDGNDLIRRTKVLSPRLRYLIHTGSSSYRIPPDLAEIGIGPEDLFKKPLSDLGLLAEAIEERTGREGPRG